VTVSALPPALANLPVGELTELMCKAHPGVWAERKRGFTNAPFHWEWYDLRMKSRRLACVAPREHAKTEVFTVNGTAHDSIYTPGIWTYVFANTQDQAMALKERIDLAIMETDPWMIDGARVNTKSESIYANFARVTVAGAGKGVRGAHPDVIVGDDVLEEGLCRTNHRRKQVESWWFGTVGGMSHPGTTRAIWNGKKVTMPPTRVYLVGTPFHQLDLLMGMKANPLYKFVRYAAEYDPGDVLEGSQAVEAA
jgi:hypothetical protein